jgi:polysaccharide export outer membrane protein
MLKLARFVLTATIPLALLACASSGGNPASSLQAGSAGQDSPRPQNSAGLGGTGPAIPAIVGAPPASSGNTYRIGAHDLLQIEVFQVEELSSQERVNEQGYIVMPLIGAVMVGGLTPKEAEEKIADILGERYLQDPQVNIFVEEYASQNVTVTGAVKKPGVFPLKGRLTLMQGIAMAEGVERVANENEVIIFRSEGGQTPKGYVVDLDQIQEGTAPDPILIADDRVVVPESGTAVFIQNLTGSVRGLVTLNPLLY